MIPRPDTPHSCTRSEEDLWAGLDAPPDEHEQQCPTCQEQRRRLAPLAETTKRWKAEDTADESILGGVLERVMQGIRAEIRRGPKFTLTITPLGPLHISGYLLLETLRDAVDSIPDVELRAHKIIPEQADAASGAISLEVALSMKAGLDGLEVAQLTRRMISTRFAERIGLPIENIDVTVEDVFQ